MGAQEHASAMCSTFRAKVRQLGNLLFYLLFG